MPKAIPYERMTRAQLLEALREHDAALRHALDRVALVNEHKVHQEDLAAQRRQLVASLEELQVSHERYRELFDLNPLPCLLLDGNGIIDRINLAAIRLFEVEGRRAVAMPFLVLAAEGHRRALLDHLRRCRSTDLMVKTELMLKTASGLLLPIELSSQVIVSLYDRRRWYHTVAMDLRERQRLEDERLQAAAERQRLEADQRVARAANEGKDRFLAALSHELRTPLTPVLLAATAWKDHPELPEPFRQTLTMIARNVEMQARLIDDLLDMTRITQGKLALHRELVDLHVLLEELVDQSSIEAEAAGLSLGLELEARQTRVDGDPVRLRQIVWNLVKNAIRFTPAGGCITVRSETPRRGTIRVAVRDTGTGFDGERRQKLFLPFEQGDRSAAQGGLGLGLAIAKGLVDAHGGIIRASSAGHGTGACFTVDLPTSDAAVATATDGARAPHHPSVAGSLRILLVEDHEDTATALSYVLELEGYQVAVAHSVSQALTAAEADNIDLVVSDLGLPDGSGLDLMRQLRADRALQGIALTGYGRPEDHADILQAGFEQHLVKPVDVSQLIAAIESMRPRLTH